MYVRLLRHRSISQVQASGLDLMNLMWDESDVGQATGAASILWVPTDKFPYQGYLSIKQAM